jgi:mannose-6-phosphate isomerase-like protein (cupin superfamily)
MSDPAEPVKPPSGRAVDLRPLLEGLRRGGDPWREVLRVPELSAGLYRLSAGATDPQAPHTEDEIYYVLTGRATLEVEGRAHPVEPGGLLYVPARARHRFTAIREDLELLVVFAPAEGSRG